MTLGLLALLATSYVLLCAWVYTRQRSLIYYPVAERSSAAGEAIALRVDGVVLKIWGVKRSGRRALLYFGGNAEDVGASLNDFAQTIPERSLYFVNYRGYGGSSGEPSEQALVADALAVFDFLRPLYDDIAVAGRSLGSGVAIQLAVNRPVSKLVLVTPFDSLVRVGQAALPWLPVSLLAKDRFESVRFAPKIACPTVVLIAAADRVIPPIFARTLVEAFLAGRAKAIEVPGAGHNDIQLWPMYYTEIAGFLDAPSGGR